jgi:hypothetical protein
VVAHVVKIGGIVDDHSLKFLIMLLKGCTIVGFTFRLPSVHIENRGNKTQNKDVYHQNSYKLRTEVTKHKTKMFTTRTHTY